MGRSIHLANYACLAQLVFRSDFARQLACPETKTAHPTSRMVHQEAADFFGRFEHCERKLSTLIAIFEHRSFIMKSEKRLGLARLTAFLALLIPLCKFHLDKV